MKQKFTIYFINSLSFTNGFVHYITNSIEKAKKLFYKEYDKEFFQISYIDYKK